MCCRWENDSESTQIIHVKFIWRSVNMKKLQLDEQKIGYAYCYTNVELFEPFQTARLKWSVSLP